MDIAIVDDSLADRKKLANDIRKYAKENTVSIRLEEYENGERFLSQISLISLDVVFLDIYMDKLSGMDVANTIYKTNSECKIIFITTSSAFAVKSYDVDAFYYMLKPYSYETLSSVLDKLDKSLKKSSRYIKVKESREFRKILLDDILYVDYSNHYVQIHTQNSIISTYMKFSEIEAKLLIYSEFLCCYRCVIANMNKIQKVDDLFFLMCNGEYIPINRKNVKEIKNHYVNYIFGIMEEESQYDD